MDLIVDMYKNNPASYENLRDLNSKWKSIAE